MASSSSSTALASRLNLNLVIDSAAGKVLYAVVGKDFLDFLFSLMQMQVAPLARALGRDQAKGCLGMLYDSLEGFSTDYMLPKVDKAQTLKPALPTNRPTQTRTLLMLRYDGQAPSVGAAPGTGWVKGGDTVYMVTDDLAVAPLTQEAQERDG